MIVESSLRVQVDTENGMVFIVNDSDCTVEICAVPPHNKRRVRAQMIIHPKQAWAIDRLTEFDLKDYYFRFV